MPWTGLSICHRTYVDQQGQLSTRQLHQDGQPRPQAPAINSSHSLHHPSFLSYPHFDIGMTASLLPSQLLLPTSLLFPLLCPLQNGIFLSLKYLNITRYTCSCRPCFARHLLLASLLAPPSCQSPPSAYSTRATSYLLALFFLGAVVSQNPAHLIAWPYWLACQVKDDQPSFSLAALLAGLAPRFSQNKKKKKHRKTGLAPQPHIVFPQPDNQDIPRCIRTDEDIH